VLCPCFTLPWYDKNQKKSFSQKKNLLTRIRLVLFLVLFIKLWMIFNGRFIDTKKIWKGKRLCNHYKPRLLLWWPLPPTYMNDKATNRLCDSAVSCLLIFTFIFMVIMKENTFDVWKISWNRCHYYYYYYFW